MTKTKQNLIRTAHKGCLLHVYKLLSDFRSWCKNFATVCWGNVWKKSFSLNPETIWLIFFFSNSVKDRIFLSLIAQAHIKPSSFLCIKTEKKNFFGTFWADSLFIQITRPNCYIFFCFFLKNFTIFVIFYKILKKYINFFWFFIKKAIFWKILLKNHWDIFFWF